MGNKSKGEIGTDVLPKKLQLKLWYCSSSRPRKSYPQKSDELGAFISFVVTISLMIRYKTNERVS